MILLLICIIFLLFFILKYFSPIDVTVPHDKSEVKISFGSTLDEDACNESFGIDDVMIYLK